MESKRKPTRSPTLIAAAALIVAALAVTILALALRDDAAGTPVRVDERAGMLRGVRFGDSSARVRELLGEPSDREQGFFPEDADFTGPPSIAAPQSDQGTRVPPETLHYDDTAFLVSRTVGVFSMATLSPAAETRHGVGVGDPLERVRERYASVRCGEAVAGEALFGDTPMYPWCRARVGDVDVFFGEDPIESITITRLK